MQLVPNIYGDFNDIFSVTYLLCVWRTYDIISFL